MSRAVTVVGIGDDGCPGLSSRAMNAVAAAGVLAGGERQLDFFPEFAGERLVLKGDLQRVVSEISERCLENTVCVLASGDPLFYGIGSMIAKKVGAAHVDFIPAPSSVQYAFARVGLKWDDAEIISLHGRPLQGFVNKLQAKGKFAVLTDDKNTPSAIASCMLEFGESEWEIFVCENLNGKNERIRSFTLDKLAAEQDISDLNVMVMQRTGAWEKPAVIPCLDETDYARRMPKKGLITKKEIRILSLAAMQIRHNSIVWDIGAGSGSVAVDAAKIARDGRVFAIETDPEGVEICRENRITHKTDNMTVIHGMAPAALADLPDPDSVFVGGSKGNLAEIIRISLQRLSVGGSLVVNAVTLDNVSEAYAEFRRLGVMPEVTLVNISRGQKLASYLRYEAQNPIHIFSATKEETAP